MPDRPTISVVVNTLNEEHHIANALGSVNPWADEIIVVDQHSDDGTVEIAKTFGAKVFEHERTGYVEPVRQFAIEKATGDWVLILDADEQVPKALSLRLIAHATSPTSEILLLPRENYIFGRFMEGTGWAANDDYQMRFFKRGSVVTTPEIHRGMHPATGATTSKLEYRKGEALLHFNYVDVSDFLERLNRYTTAEATKNPNPPSKARSLRRAWRQFRTRYFKEGGRKEGWQGFYLSLMMAFYSLATDAKVNEARESAGRPVVQERYDEVAAAVVREYGP